MRSNFVLLLVKYILVSVLPDVNELFYCMTTRTKMPEDLHTEFFEYIL
jgi:hypothetical protein